MLTVGSITVQSFQFCADSSCCYTGFFGNIFDEGEFLSFHGANIGECDGYDVGDITTADTISE